MSRKKLALIAGLVLSGAGLVVAWACIRRPMQLPQPKNRSVQVFVMPQSAQRDLDLLFLVDNSLSMNNEQQNLRTQFEVLMDTLKHMRGGLPNVHIGVVTSDLGTGTYTNIPGCTRLGGDKGILGQSGATNRGEQYIGAGQKYIVDVEPKGCRIERTVLETGVRCSSHDCTQANCDQAKTPGSNETLTLYTDENGCPRCRNYDGTLESVFQDYAYVGDQGCGFEQQLEAVKKALDRQDPDAAAANTGFLRDGAYLGVIWVTDEDDCSASKPEVIFNPDENQNNINSPLGPLTSYRCFEFGITCDINDRTVQGTRTNCVPRTADDPNNYLFPVNRYTAFLEGLKDPEMMVIAAIAGPVTDTVNVTTDNMGRPKVDFSCLDPVNPNEGGTPGIRIRAVVSYFNGESDLNEWAYTSICSQDFSSALRGIGQKLVEAMSEKCLSQPFAGCTNGPSGTSCSPCYPSCEVTVILNRGTPSETTKKMRWCGEVCQEGVCTPADLQPCNYDEANKCTCGGGLYPTVLTDAGGQVIEGCAPLRYPNADPELERDPALGSILGGNDDYVAACWYLSSDTSCTVSLGNGQEEPAKAGFKVVWAQDPPPRTFLKAACATVPPTEQLCADGVDNDEDCKIDTEDSDCLQ